MTTREMILRLVRLYGDNEITRYCGGSNKVIVRLAVNRRQRLERAIDYCGRRLKRELRGLLADLQWVDSDGTECPACGGREPEFARMCGHYRPEDIGHRPGCKIAARLA